MSGYEYDDGYNYEYEDRRKRRRKKRHPVFFLLLAAVFAVLCWQGIKGMNWNSAASAGYRQTGQAAVSAGAAGGDDGLSADTSKALEAMAEKDPKARPVVQNPEQYPERLLESLGRNPELLDFTLDYPKKKGTFSKRIDLTDQYQNDQIPLLMQWDEKWGYAPYGDGIIGLDGCGPTSLSMVVIGLTGDTSKNPKAIADFSQKHGYLDEKSDSTLWTLMSEGAGKLGLNSREIPLSRDRMTKELSEGHPIICCMGPGDFTTQGHFLVISRVQDGAFVVRDPNSKERSRETWSYDRLKPQIRNLWAFSA